mgnify:CR=1 FL=1
MQAREYEFCAEEGGHQKLRCSRNVNEDKSSQAMGGHNKEVK